MVAAKKGLLLIFRPESSDDFREIARRVYKIDPSIYVVGQSAWVKVDQLPKGFLNLPLLVIYLVNPPPDSYNSKSATLAVSTASKIDEYHHYKRNGIPCLPIENFRWGMDLDPKIYGDYVVIKPENLNSTGKDINMIPTELIKGLKPQDFPEDHLIHKDTYLVQKFVKSENRPTHYRVLVFLDEVLYSRRAVSNIPYPENKKDLSLLLRTSVASNNKDRVNDFYKDPEINELAITAAKTFPKNPIFGFDIIREEKTKNLYILEGNIGGNVWHFSSEFARQGRGLNQLGRKALVHQYNAWDRAAEALVRKTNELAK